MAVSHLTKELEALSLEGKKKSLKLGDFDIRLTVGTGSFGRVLLAKHKGTSAICVLKCLRKTEILRAGQLEHVVSEKTILSQLDHPFIPKMFACFQDDVNVYMVLEYIIGGEMFTHLSNRGQFSHSMVQIYAGEIVLVLEYLHGMDIVYRDLKPENILIARSGHIKVTDFGFAKKLEDRTYTLCGTVDYLAPELVQKTGHGFGVDFWALGVLIYEMLAGEAPFEDDSPLRVCAKIMEADFEFSPHVVWESSAKDIILKLLEPDLTQRLGCMRSGIKDVKNHEFFPTGSFWDDLLARKIPAPIIPEVGGDDDSSNFDQYDEEDFTAFDAPPDQSLFKDFSN